MAATVVIHEGEKQNVLRVAAECVTMLEGTRGRPGAEPRKLELPVCYVKTPTGLERRNVVLGMVGTQFAEIVSGVDEGMSVLRFRDLAARLHNWLHGKRLDERQLGGIHHPGGPVRPEPSRPRIRMRNLR